MAKNYFFVLIYMEKMSNEFCIVPEGANYATERFLGSHRHEIFFGAKCRQKSIDFGLVVFLTPEMHNMSKNGVHQNREFDLYLKQIGQRAAMDYYGWDIDRFIQEFGRNYL